MKKLKQPDFRTPTYFVVFIVVTWVVLFVMNEAVSALVGTYGTEVALETAGAIFIALVWIVAFYASN